MVIGNLSFVNSRRRRIGNGRRKGLDEFAVTGDFREETADRPDHQDGRQAAGYYRENRAEEVTDQTGLETAQLIGGADE